MAIWHMRDQEEIKMNIEQLKETLKVDEGVVYEIYKDHLGYPTFGIGHLVLEKDQEFGVAVGTAVSEERVDECFESDVQTVIEDCIKLHSGWDGYPQEAKQIIANMMFNMGLTRLSKFNKHNAALQCGDWKEAAKEGRDSRWYKQVTNRAERLMKRLEEI
jgi:lysozyme